MKKKYIAMVALAGWIGVTGWLSSMVIVKPAVLFLGNNIDETAEAAQLRAAVQRNKAVLEAASKLRPPSTVAANADLIAVPPQPANPVVLEGGVASLDNSDSPQEALPSRLSLIIRTQGVVSAIVDDTRVQVGSRLPNGGRVAAIGDNWLRVRHTDGSSHTLRLPAPGAASSGGASR